jgi:hypothetical protein
VIVTTQKGTKGYGMTFTLGRGTNIVCTAIETMKFLLENQSLDEIYGNFGAFWRKLTSEPQLRWVIMTTENNYCDLMARSSSQYISLDPKRGFVIWQYLQ